MSLTSILDAPATLAFLETRVHLPGCVTNPATRIPVRPGHDPSTTGTAFDYALRMGLAAREGNRLDRLVAENGVALAFRQVDDPQYIQRVRQVWGHACASIKGPPPKVELSVAQATACVHLARLDVIYRAGPGLARSALFSDVSRTQIDELRELYAIIPWAAFESQTPIVLNPSFGEGSIAVGGADADVVLDDCIIDIKTIKEQKLRVAFVQQLVGYALLANSYGITGGYEPEITELGIYYSRAGMLVRFSVDACIDREDRVEVLQHLTSRRGSR